MFSEDTTVRPSNILVVGRGFIANSLIKSLKQFGVNVFQIYAKSYHLSGLCFTFKPLISGFDQNYFDMLIYATGSCNHVKADEDPRLDLDSHLHVLREVAYLTKSLLKHNSRHILISSGGCVYGNFTAIPSGQVGFLEQDTPSPVNNYGRRCYVIEQEFVQLFGQDSSHILRLSNPFGVDQFHVTRKGLIATLILSNKQAQPVFIRDMGRQVRNFFSINLLPYLINYVLRHSTNEVPHIINCGSLANLSCNEIVSLVSSVLGHDLNVQLSGVILATDAQNAALDCTLLSTLLEENVSRRYLSLEGVVEDIHLMVDYARREQIIDQ